MLPMIFYKQPKTYSCTNNHSEMTELSVRAFSDALSAHSSSLCFSAELSIGKFHCGFEEDTICMFTQDKTEEFDWTRHSAASRDTKYTPNTGPSSDRTGSKQGFYMYIETSRPRLEGDKARLLTPSFNVAPKNPYGNVATNPTYCFSFYYHMYGKHIGTLNVYLRQKSQTGQDTSVWTLSGNQGDRWRQARVNINPTSSFQMVLEGIRGSGIEGDIAVDDVAIEEGECRDPPPSSNIRSMASPAAVHIWQLWLTLLLVLVGLRRWPHHMEVEPSFGIHRDFGWHGLPEHNNQRFIPSTQKERIGFRSVWRKRKPGKESVITPESTQDLVEKPITVFSVIKNRTGGWLQQDSLRDLIGESFKAQRHKMYFCHYMVFALFYVCYCHQRPHNVTTRNPEPYEGSFRGGKKTMMVTKMNDRLEKKNKFSFFFYVWK